MFLFADFRTGLEALQCQILLFTRFCERNFPSYEPEQAALYGKFRGVDYTHPLMNRCHSSVWNELFKTWWCSSESLVNPTWNTHRVSREEYENVHGLRGIWGEKSKLQWFLWGEFVSPKCMNSSLSKLIRSIKVVVFLPQSSCCATRGSQRSFPLTLVLTQATYFFVRLVGVSCDFITDVCRPM